MDTINGLIRIARELAGRTPDAAIDDDTSRRVELALAVAIVRLLCSSVTWTLPITLKPLVDRAAELAGPLAVDLAQTSPIDRREARLLPDYITLLAGLVDDLRSMRAPGGAFGKFHPPPF